MSWKIVSGILLTMLLIGMSTLTFDIHSAKTTKSNAEGALSMSAPETEWNKVYGEPNEGEVAHSVVQRVDQGYEVACETRYGEHGYQDALFIKTDTFGELTLSVPCGGSDEDAVECLVKTSDGGFGATGHTYSFGAGGVDFWLVKTNSEGYMQWSKTYGGTGTDYAHSLVVTSDGGFALVGWTDSFGVGTPLRDNVWLVKTDVNGNVEWNKTYGDLGHEYAYSLIQTNDEGYVIAGTIQPYPNGDYDFLLIKTDSDGNLLWSKTFGGEYDDNARSVVQTLDGGYAIVGHKGLPDWDFDVFFVKTNSAGEMQWSKTYGYSGPYEQEYGSRVLQTNEGRYAVLGWRAPPSNEILLIRTTASGEVIWNKTIEGGYPCSIIQANDEGFAIAGAKSEGTGYTDSWLIKLRPEQKSHDIAVTNIHPHKTLITQGYSLEIDVTVTNKGDNIESFNLTIFANTTAIQTQTITASMPDEHKTLNFTWNSVGFPKGKYIIKAVAHPVDDEIDTTDNTLTDGIVTVIGVGGIDGGYFIIVAGDYGGDLIDIINNGCNQTYKILRELGYSNDSIYYMAQPDYYPQDVDGDGCNDVDAYASSYRLYRAITDWASSRVNSYTPLFLYLFDHGAIDGFAIHGPSDILYAGELASWLDTLENATSAPIHVIYAACHSGSFINDLSKDGRVIITSSRWEQVSYVSPDETWDAFSQPFWSQIQAGHSLGSSFEYAGEVVESYWPPRLLNETEFGQSPLLDDNGDAVGNRVPLPNNGDGYLASSIFIGHCEWPYPWTSYVIAKQFFTWPPPPAVTLWAKTENKTPLLYVKAWMKPPDWTPPTPDIVLPDMGFECFEMTDANHDGNWTVNVPAINFTNHATGPSNFTFVITAEEESGRTTIPLITGVAFTDTGLPPIDDTRPRVHIERPIEGRTVQDTIAINGTVSDDVCVQKVELHVNGIPSGTVGLSAASNSFFQFNLDTTTLSNGPNAILVKAFDTSNNIGNQTITLYVNNFVHDIIIIDTQTSKTVIGQGYTLRINVTIANHGSYTETLNVTVYCNETEITQPNGKPYITATLTSQNSTTITFTWNTTGLAKGNYIISAVATQVPGETDASDNILTDGAAIVTIPGDINGDYFVNIQDATQIGLYWMKTVPPAPPNADINGDGIINIKDATVIGTNWLKHA